MRFQHARAWQCEPFDEIWLEPGATPLPADLAAVGDYEHGPLDDGVE
jgi:hypothetical protein